MFGHMPELIIILVIALIVFGPEKLPEVAANAGRMVREVRDAMDSAMNPEDVDVSDDFSSYYHDSLTRSGDEEEYELLDEDELDVEDLELEDSPGLEPEVEESPAAEHPVEPPTPS